MRKTSAFPWHRLAVAAALGLAASTAAAQLNYELGNHFSSGPLSVSTDGRFVLFTSAATNLDPVGNHDGEGLFVLDTATETFERLETHDLSDPDDFFYFADAAISDDGRYVLFNRRIAVPGAPMAVSQVYRLDRTSGISTLVSADAGGNPGTADSFAESLSGDGRYGVFFTRAPNVIGGAGARVLRHDFASGTNELVSLMAPNQPASSDAGYAEITPNGRHVTFYSSGNLYVRDMVAGTTALVSAGANGSPVGVYHMNPPYRGCSNRVISADGRYVMFTTSADIEAGDTNLDLDVYRRDVVSQTSQRVSTDTVFLDSRWPRCGTISTDGSKAAYLVSISGGDAEVMMRDMSAATPSLVTRGYNLEELGAPTLRADGGALFFTSHVMQNWIDRQLVRYEPRLGITPLTRVLIIDAVFADGFEL